MSLLLSPQREFRLQCDEGPNTPKWHTPKRPPRKNLIACRLENLAGLSIAAGTCRPKPPAQPGPYGTLLWNLCHLFAAGLSDSYPPCRTLTGALDGSCRVSCGRVHPGPRPDAPFTPAIRPTRRSPSRFAPPGSSPRCAVHPRGFSLFVTISSVCDKKKYTCI